MKDFIAGNDFVVKLGSDGSWNNVTGDTKDSIKLNVFLVIDWWNKQNFVFIPVLCFILDQDWYILIGFGAKLKIINISLISPIREKIWCGIPP